MGSGCVLWAIAQNTEQKAFLDSFFFSRGFAAAVSCPRAWPGAGAAAPCPLGTPRRLTLALGSFSWFTAFNLHSFSCLLDRFLFEAAFSSSGSQGGFSNRSASPLTQQISATPQLLLPCSCLRFPSRLPAPLDLGIGKLCSEGPSSAPDGCSVLLWPLL